MTEQAGKPLSGSTWADMGVRQKGRHVISNVTVEPIVILYTILRVMSGLATQNLAVQKACRVSLNYSAELCQDLFQNETAYPEVSKVVANMQLWQSPLFSAGPVVVALFAGSWADRRRLRKPFLLAPLFGNMLCSTGLLLCAIFFAWPLEVNGFIEAFVPSLFGDPMLSVFSYIAIVSTKEDRTFRIGIVHTSANIAATLGTALSGVAYTSLGFEGVYIVNIVISCLGLIYGHYVLKEPEPPMPQPPGVSFLADFCNWHHVMETLQVSFKKRPGSQRLQLWLVIFLYIAVEGVIVGESSVYFLYLTQRFKWESLQISAFFTFTGIIDSVGCFFATTVFAKWLHMGDCMIGVIAVGSNALTTPVFALASAGWVMYAGYATSMLGSGAMITMRGIASKLVAAEELGKVMSLLAIGEAVIPLVFVALYSEAYSVTADSHPGTFWYISLGVSLLAILLYSAIWRLQWNGARTVNSSAMDDAVGVSNAACDGPSDV